MSSFRSGIVLAPLAFASLGSAQTVLLRFKPPVGKTVTYMTALSMTQSVPGMATPMGFTQTTPTTYRIVSRAGGATTIQTKTGMVKVTMPAGSPMAAQKAMMEKQSSGMTSTMVVDEFGGFKSMGIQGGSSAARQMGANMVAGAQGVTFPKGPVKVGDTWSGSLDLGKMMGNVSGMGMKVNGKIPIVYRLVGVEKRGGTSLAKLSMVMKGSTTMTMGGAGAPGGKAMSFAMKMDSKGTLLVDSATGLLQSMSSSSDTVTQIMGQNMKQHMTMNMTAK